MIGPGGRPCTMDTDQKDVTDINVKSMASRRRRLGIALCGGGIRGLAHIGVLRLLEEENIAVDAISGTSMGGLIAGAIGAGIPLDELAAFAVDTKIVDLASPDRTWRGFFDHRKMRSLLADLLGSDDLRFEDLAIPVSVVAADLETGELVILDSGHLIPALLATSALPLLFAPVRWQGRWLVDGGVLNNLPVDIVRQMGADVVIGVDIPPTTGFDLEVDPEFIRSRGPSLRRLFRFGGQLEWRLPFLIAETSIGMTQRLINRTRLEICPPDLLLQVQLPSIGVLSTDGSGDAIEAGYRAALSRVNDLRRVGTQPKGEWRSRLRRVRRRWGLAWRILRGPDYPLYPPQNGVRSQITSPSAGEE